ncbi:MAG TPA: DUF1150 family protein [Azospirillum sp.]|nr:DUF1150 family protein [Azospirillum sp.]
MSGNDFVTLGLMDRCYVKRVTRRGRTSYACYAADGTYLWRYPSREIAFAALRQHDMEPLSAH